MKNLLFYVVAIFLSSVGAVNAQTKINLPKDTSFHETIRPVNDLNGDGISDYIYTHINGKGIPESTIIEGKTNVNTFFGWRIGQMESFIIVLSAFLGLLWFPYNRLYNKIVDVRTEMKEEVKATEERLNKRMDESEERLNKKMHESEERLNKRMDESEERLNKRMDESEERLNKRMDKAEQDIKEVKEEVKEVKKTLSVMSEILVKIETRLNTEERLMQIISNQNNQLNNQLNNK